MKNNRTDASWNGRTARRRKRFPSACPLRRHGEHLTHIIMSTNNRWKHTLACMLCNGFGLQVERRLFKIDAVLRPSPAIRQVCTRLVTQMKSTLLEMSWKIKLRNLKHLNESDKLRSDTIVAADCVSIQPNDLHEYLDFCRKGPPFVVNVITIGVWRIHRSASAWHCPMATVIFVSWPRRRSNEKWTLTASTLPRSLLAETGASIQIGNYTHVIYENWLLRDEWNLLQKEWTKSNRGLHGYSWIGWLPSACCCWVTLFTKLAISWLFYSINYWII